MYMYTNCFQLVVWHRPSWGRDVTDASWKQQRNVSCPTQPRSVAVIYSHNLC